MNNTSSSFFLGANTPGGFYSLFSELTAFDEKRRLYVLKGGPGTGKSTVMKKVAAECDRRGLYCERIFCSSDPKSLDAVIIPSLKTAVADGTAPHVIEPRFPGVVEKTVELGQFRDDKRLRENGDEIIRLFKENSFHHKKCVDFMAAAKGVDNDTVSVVLSSLRINRLHKFAERFAGVKLTATSNEKGRVSKRFLSALTSEGMLMFSDTFSSMAEEKIVLKDSFGCASSVFLKIISIKAAEQGLDIIRCNCPMSPDYKTEHIIIPSMSLGFFTSNRWHPDSFEGASFVDCMRFYDTDSLKRHKNRIAFNRRSRDELLGEAVNKLHAAKAVHDSLEKYYIEVMDFDRVKEESEKIVREIFEGA